MDPRLEAAVSALHAEQDRYAAVVAVYRFAQAAYARSRSQKNRATLIAAGDACDAFEFGALHDEIDRVEALVEAERQEAERAAEAALQPTLF